MLIVLAHFNRSVTLGLEMSFNQETYRVGDLVYVEATERNMENHVYLIERLWTANDGQQMFLGNWFCRPNETFHLASRKFLEQVKLSLHIMLFFFLKQFSLF